MTDKERIKEWVENSLSDVESKINGMFGFSEGLYPELIAKRVVLKDLLSLINTLEVRDLQKEPVSEDFEKALAEEWKGYIDRGAATVDALEDNTQELAFAKGFYRGAKWQKAKDEHLIWQISSANYEKGKQEGKEQIMENATEAIVAVDAGGYPYIPQIELYDYDKDVPLAKEGDKYKVVLIKED